MDNIKIETKDDLIELLEHINSINTCKLFVDFCNDDCPFMDDYNGCTLDLFVNTATDKIRLTK